MAGGRIKYRHLSRSSAHRQALLRNLVTSLFTHESISTTWHKAKEAQPLAEMLVTLAKKNTEASRRRALSIFYTPHALLPKLFGEIRERYALRPGGYTRVLRIEPLKDDQAPSAILELVDGPKDMRFAMTAKTLMKIKREGNMVNDITRRNIQKVTKFRPDGERALDEMVQKMRNLKMNTRVQSAQKKENKGEEEEEEGEEEGEEEREEERKSQHRLKRPRWVKR